MHILDSLLFLSDSVFLYNHEISPFETSLDVQERVIYSQGTYGKRNAWDFCIFTWICCKQNVQKKKKLGGL